MESEIVDDDSYWAIGNATRLTIQDTGWHIVGGWASWDTTDNVGIDHRLRLNGSSSIAVQGLRTGANNNPLINFDTLFYFTAADYVELQVFQNSGSDKTLNKSLFWIYQV